MSTAGDQLHLLYEINRRLTTLSDLDELVHYATQRTRELFGAEGCALLLLDAERHEFFFPVASQSESLGDTGRRLSEIRFPADRGIAGWVLGHSEAVVVDDVTKDARFFQGVDKQTTMTTRSLLCAPLRTQSGNIGVIEVVNPAASALSADSLEFLSALADDIGVAYEKAALTARLRAEAVGLRQVCRVAGYGLLAIGVVVVMGAVLGHLAMALPLSELPTRPGMLSGGVSMLVGLFLVGVASGRFVRPHAAPSRT